MKNILLLLIPILLFSLNSSSQNTCSKFYPMVEGSTFEYTNYDKKGKSEGVSMYTITKVTTHGNSTEAVFDIKYVDEKGKDVIELDYTITCADNIVRIDYESLMPSQMMKQYEDMGMEMEISGTDIELPNNLTVGQELADANVSVTMKMTGMKMEVTVDMVNRKVEKKENVTTPAGTFDCFMISEDNISKVVMANQEMHSKIWLAEGVGMIKQETYKKNGDLQSRTELTKYSQ